MSTKLIRSVTAGCAVLALFALAVGVAGAQRGPQGPGAPGRGQDGGAPGGEMGDAYVNDLATNLGVTPDALRSAMSQTRDDMRPMMEERMGQMRDQMRAHMDEMGQDGAPRFGRGAGDGADNRPMGRPGGFGPGGMPFGGPGMAEAHDQMMATVAGLLGMQPDDLQSQITGGQTLADIARAQGKDPDALADQLTTTVMQEHQTQLRSMIRQAMDHSFIGPRRGGENQ